MNQHHTEIENATCVYVPGWIRDYVREMNRVDQHPRNTVSGYDFRMNLDVFG